MRNPASIECTLSKATLKAIPATTSERKRFLQGRIGAFVGKDFPCPALGGKVKVIKKSVGETAFHACKSRRSTICALMLPAIIKNAELAGTTAPKGGRQTKEFFFKKIHNLEVRVKYYGTARLTVGERSAGNFVEYCITNIKIARP
jgi:hypothetical protein